MRFEIRSGGIAAILIGLALLSGGVFVLGLLAGYDVGRESQTTTEQVATAYPVQAPPAAVQNANVATVSAAEAGVATTSTGTSETGKPAVEPEATANGVDKGSVNPASSGGPDAVAQGVSPTATPSPSPAAEPSNIASNGEASEEGGDAAAHEGRHKPYNIQIRAAMDLNGGNAMMKRLEQLGYQAHLLPTEIAGQTWYRVEVGPYTSQQEAAAAEVELRQKYNSTYGGGHPAKAQAPANTGGPPAQAGVSGQSTAQSSN
ncbi:MAG TPA: SPOR domain-containing protein [Candidatus Binataceae bacterium]|nr:SPOR domain-containing protein [Candidatus Binataceae bacterium]